MPQVVPAIIGAVTAVGSFITSLGVFGEVLISIGLSVAARALRKKPKQPPGGTSLTLEYGADRPRKVAGGLVGTAGAAVYDNTYGEANKYWQRVFRLADYPVDGLSRVAIGGQWVELAEEETGTLGRAVITGEAAGYVWIKFYDGRQTTADPGLVANARPASRWTSRAVGTGVCYAVVTALYDRQNFTSAPRMFFELRGSRLYDWRKDETAGGSGNHRWNDPSTWSFTENPVVIEYNYRRGLSVSGDDFCGMFMPAGDLPLDKWTLAANICDEDAGGEPRYRASILIDSGDDHGDVIEALSQATGAMVVDGVEGAWPIIGTAQPIVATLTEDDMIEGGRPRFRARRSAAALVNSVSGTFSDPGNLWSPAPYERQTSATALAADRRTLDATIDFATVRSQRQANQLAAIYMSENRFEATISGLVFKPRWRVLEVGDWIGFHSTRWGQRTYIVSGRRIRSLEADGPRVTVLDLQERSAAIYGTVGVTIPAITPPPNQRPRYLQEVQGLAIVPVTLTGDNGAAQAGIRISWSTITDPTVTGVQIEYRPTAQPDRTYTRQVYDGVTVVFLSEGVVEQTEYQIRTRLLTTGRPTVATALQTVTTNVLPEISLAAELEELEEEVNELFRELNEDLENLFGRMDILGENADETAAAVSREEQSRVAGDRANTRLAEAAQAKADAADAAVRREAGARAAGDRANATLANAARAVADRALAGGVFRLRAEASPNSSTARFSVLVRAGLNDRYIQSGMVIEATATRRGRRSRIAFRTDQFIITDGRRETLPFLFENGAAKMNVANIGTVTAGRMQSRNRRLVIDLNAPLITMDDGR